LWDRGIFREKEEVKIMRIDLYTKIVLTGIAACLLLSLVKSSFSPREATAQGVQSVYVKGGSITIDGGAVGSYKRPVYVEVTNPYDFE